MILLFNTLEERNEAFLIEKNIIISKQRGRKNSQREDLLKVIDIVLDEAEKSIHDVAKIAVVAGSGRFSTVRQAVVTANALGFVLNIPVCSINKEIFYAKDFINLISSTCQQKRVFRPVLPIYSHEPNISQPKNKKH